MPKIPERKLSLGEELNKQKKLYSHVGTKDIPTWIVEEVHKNSKNGSVKTTRLASKLPAPYKCSACSFTAETRPLLDRHWSEEH